MENPFGLRKRNQVAKCPRCGAPHRYVNVKNPMVNDPGYWVVQCSECAEPFCIANLHDVYDSFAASINILSQEEGNILPVQTPVATEIAVYSLELNELRLYYDYSASPLYECLCLKPLDMLARQQLAKEFDEIVTQYKWRVHYALKGRFHAEYVVAKVQFVCECGARQVATYYTKFIVDNNRMPLNVDDFILADVSGAELSNTLDGIRSKDDAMNLLAKLVMRWNLMADQVLVASPFIGHQYLSPADQLSIWEWLLSMLDSRIAVFVTRATTWKAYRRSMQEAGLPVEVLEQYGLENKVVSAGQSKQDFHAKFYAGLSDSWCEVYSGSANLVRGPSMENTSFRKMTREEFGSRYLARMEFKQQLPQSGFKAATRSLVIYQSQAVG